MKTINITIRNTLNDQQYKLKVPENIIACSLLEQLASKVNIPETYVLAIGDKVVEENAPLSDAGVGDGSVLKLMPNPVGGNSQTLALLQLPDELWKKRIEFEYGMIRSISEKEQVDFKVNDTHTEYEITFSGEGLVKDADGRITKNLKNTVKVVLNRNFPYAGGINIKWIAPKSIFHPNIDPPMVCMGLINMWKPMNDLAGVIEGLRWMLQHPNLNDPYKNKKDVARWYEKNFRSKIC